MIFTHMNTPKPGSSKHWPWPVYFQEKQGLPLSHYVFQMFLHLQPQSDEPFDFIRVEIYFRLANWKPTQLRELRLNVMHHSVPLWFCYPKVKGRAMSLIYFLHSLPLFVCHSASHPLAFLYSHCCTYCFPQISLSLHLRHSFFSHSHLCFSLYS